jgi:hypothetical protein
LLARLPRGGDLLRRGGLGPIVVVTVAGDGERGDPGRQHRGASYESGDQLPP